MSDESKPVICPCGNPDPQHAHRLSMHGDDTGTRYFVDGRHVGTGPKFTQGKRRPPPRPLYRSECDCDCHLPGNVGMMHFVACCQPDPPPKR